MSFFSQPQTRNYINVKDFGAVGDGVTDDTGPISRALLTAQSALGGAPIWFPPSTGAYITSTITAFPGMTLLGSNDGNFGGLVPTANRSILKLKAGANGSLISGPVSASNVRIRDLELDGNSSNQTGGATSGLIHLVDDTNPSGDEAQWIIERCNIHHGYGHNVYLGQNRRASFLRDNVITWSLNGDGVLVAGSDNTISGGFIGDSGRNGIGVGNTNTQLYSSTGNAAFVTTIYGVGIFKSGQTSAGAAIAVAQGSNETMIFGCGIDRNVYQGVVVYDGSTTKITNCSFHSNYTSANNAGAHIDLASGVVKIALDNNSFGKQDGDVANLTSWAVTVASSSTSIHGNIGVQDPTDSVNGIISNSANWVGQTLANNPLALYGYLGWAYDPAAVNGGNTPSAAAGQITLIKIPWPITRSVTNIVVALSAGGTLTAGQCFAGVYDASGTRLGVTADQSGVWNAAGTAPKVMAISGGPITIPGGGETGFIYVAILWNGTVAPQIYKAANAVSAVFNGSLSAANLRCAVNSSGNTSLPSSLTLSASTASNNFFWAAVS